jgi:hypothetical protein
MIYLSANGEILGEFDEVSFKARSARAGLSRGRFAGVKGWPNGVRWRN